MVIFFLILLVTATAIGGDMLAADSALEQIRTDLRNATIIKAKVMFVRYEILTRARITPEALEEIANVNGFIKTFDLNTNMRATLLDALEKTRIGSLNEEPDLRWGVIFYNAKGEMIHSVYINGKLFDHGKDISGTSGTIDGNLAILNGILFHWFETTFRDSMAIGANPPVVGH
jgi:hypothetical protein